MKTHLHLLTAVAALALLTGPALAGHHEGGDDKGPKMFEKLDADGNGDISEAEFVAAHKKRFDEIDANSDGAISKDEAKAHHEARKAKWKERREEYKARKGSKGERHSGDHE